MLYTKSIRNANEKDGIKISIMRYNPKAFQYDLWIPKLAPSDKLLNDYKQNKISWEEYEIKFKEQIKTEGGLIDVLVMLAEKQDITLYCYELTPEKCHRRIVAESCKEKCPGLEVCIK